MNSASNSIFFRCILILSMSLSWISETFGSFETKKAISSVKKVLKITYKSFSFKKNIDNEISNDNFFVKADCILTKNEISTKPLNSPSYLNNRLPQVNMVTDKLKKQLLFPKHGFW
ncbi:MAG: hypothetical protein EOP46_14720 [Sphingobacteriaceae bacterium]|nr:MAG: hypothetical protein EOP46_14720 [Sphingobacteriaceae bacterium]